MLFALLRRENHTELLPQLLSLKTVRRTVFLTLEPLRVRIPTAPVKEKEHPEGCSFSLAETVGFEPTCRSYRQTDFESAPL